MKKRQMDSFLFLLLVAALFAILIFVLPGELPGTPMQTIEEQVLMELAQYDEVKPYASLPATVDMLAESDLAEKRRTTPTIYSDVPTGSYEVMYEGDTGLLVLYDFSAKKVLKLFIVQNMVL